MGEPKVMFADIANDVAEAEGWLEAAAVVNNEQGVLCALRSLAASQLAITKLLLRREVNE